MKIHLRDKNPDVVEAWKVIFRGVPDIKEDGVEISQGDIFGYGGRPVKADAIVSPANSFGFMDGGIDYIYSMRWPHIQGDLQEVLFRDHYGELPIGQAVIIPTKETDIPWLISAPTMRVPGFVGGTVNAYLAFRAALIAVIEHNKKGDIPVINSILCPGLGTAVGRMDPKACAIQMCYAYKMIMKGEKISFDDLTQGWNAHEFLRRGVM
jgi:O-acetyl-ADP-ribose deacetylase (regulator of RNase III)